MLQLENVTKRYKTKAGDVEALKGVSITFPTTGLVFITGKSGCGKTTLLNVIGGLDGIDGGEIFVQDKRFSTFSAAEYDSYRNTFIGFIFQEYNLLPEFTVEKNIKMAMELQGREANEEEFQQLIEDVGIDEFKDRHPSELSGGQRQRVAIARALLKNPRIIMADEPTGALDSETGTQVLDTLKKLSKRTLIIVVSHDREFAEKYADRIIHLVDGQIAQDVTFKDNQIESNIKTQGDTLIVKQGSDLTEEEKNAIAKAVKESKGIEIVESAYFRDKAPTDWVERIAEEPVALKKSQMKVGSAMHLGVKSLVVKPVRLILTILISAIAFAVFGLFDTIANFSTEKVFTHQLKTFSETVVVSPRYIRDYENGDFYDTKVSQSIVRKMQSKTGGTVKGIFDLYENTQGGVKQTLSITELITTSVGFGSKYYTKSINGFVEFDPETEISSDGEFDNFDYEVAVGEYPTLGDNEDLYQIAISTYLADSIMHYLNGAPLNGVTLTTYEDFLDARLTINSQKYTIVGLIDCGKIPSKYDDLKEVTFASSEVIALENDFKGLVDSSLRKCLFVADGFLEAVMAKKKSADIYQIVNSTWSMQVDNSPKKVTSYVYNAEDYGANNILLFSGEYPESGELELADDEVLIHSINFENLLDTYYLYEMELLSPQEQMNVRGLISQIQKGDREHNRDAIDKIFKKLGVNTKEINIESTIKQTSSVTNEKTEKKVKIVGVYFGIESDSYVSSTSYKLMMNETLMEELGIYTDQGPYTKLIFSERSLRKGKAVIVDYLLEEEGLAFTWYNNSTLESINTHETTIRQVADLFLYAAIALSLFSIFMLYNYISVSISSKKQSVGVLRALGAGGKDILLTFLGESLIVAVVNGILANIFAVLGCALVNAYIVNIMNISIHFALFGLRQIVLISAISLITAILSSTLPIVKISKKKPIELIRRP